MIADCVEQVNADLASDPKLCASQVSRFLILHKELDPDDDELTRTRKVRRAFIAQKYGVLIDALFDGKPSQFIETEVKFEDGRVGRISADLKIRPVKKFPRHRPSRLKVRHMSDIDRDQRIGDVMLDMQNISLSFGGVKALTDISFNVREHEIRAIIGPNGAGKARCSTSSTASTRRSRAASRSGASASRA